MLAVGDCAACDPAECCVPTEPVCTPSSRAPSDDHLPAPDLALDAVRAMIEAAALPMAVFDAAGHCLAANRPFLLRAAVGVVPAGAQRSNFSPDPHRRWSLACLPGDGLAAVTSGPLMDPHAVDFFDSVANALPMMFNARDRESRFLFMNRYQAELLGTTPEAAVGATAADLLGADFGAYVRGLDLEVLRSGRPMPFFEESYAVADGSVRRWLTSKVPMTADDGVVWGVATVSIDITDRTRLEHSLRLAKEQAEAASRAKSGFLAAMSHELRTPLNAVIGFAEIIHQQVLGPIGTAEYADYAGHILSSGQHLLALINDILDFARLESGSLRLNLAAVDLDALLRGALALLEPIALQAGVHLDAELPDRPLVVRGDAQRLRQAVLHVAGNAIKFSPANGRVSIGLAPQPGGAGARVTVADTGVGIQPADMPRLFEPFWQADSGLNRLRQGAGIGLKLARQLVTAHGGRLDVSSRLGEGTLVTILLPAEAPVDDVPLPVPSVPT